MKITYVDHMGSDLSVVNAARVSFGKSSDFYDFSKHHKETWSQYSYDPKSGGERAILDKDVKLIKYLAREKHLSPFNHTFLTCHVKAPIFVARQLVKHEYMPWNEISRRYVDSEPEFYYPEVWRARAKDKKQGSSSTVRIELHDDVIRPYPEVDYEMLLEEGVAPEQARMVLPLNTYTEWYWSGTLGAWMKMYNLRIKEDTQEETRMIAEGAGSILKEYFPVSFEALSDG